jgi:hypothetical protein
MEEDGSMRDRPAVVNDQPPDPEPLNWGQSSISVRQEDLLVEAVSE